MGASSGFHGGKESNGPARSLGRRDLGDCVEPSCDANDVGEPGARAWSRSLTSSGVTRCNRAAAEQDTRETADDTNRFFGSRAVRVHVHVLGVRRAPSPLPLPILGVAASPLA